MELDTCFILSFHSIVPICFISFALSQKRHNPKDGVANLTRHKWVKNVLKAFISKQSKWGSSLQQAQSQCSASKYRCLRQGLGQWRSGEDSFYDVHQNPLLTAHWRTTQRLTTSWLTRVVIIRNMPSRQPRQLVFNCTWEDQLETAGWAFSFFNVNEAAALDICVRESCKVTLMIYLQWVAGTAGKPNHSKSVYTYKVTPRRTTLSLIDKYCLHSLVPFSALTSPHLFFFLLVLSDCVKAVALEARGGSWCLTKGGFSCAKGDKDASPHSYIVNRRTV